MMKSTFIRNNKLVTRSRDEKGRFVRGDFEKLNIYILINQLQEVARRILDNVFYLVNYQYQLGNLVDSTACAVYVNGELVDDSIEYAYHQPISIGPSKSKPQEYAVNSGMTGRAAIDKWFSENRNLPVKKKNVVNLVAIAAMHYGYYLENGLYGGPEIQVISGITDEIEKELFGLANEAGYSPSITEIAGVGKID